jgi:SAM-dependent methyltransferase
MNTDAFVHTLEDARPRGGLMKRVPGFRLMALLAVMTLVTPPTWARAQDAPDLPPADEVVARYVEAVGGRNAILSHQARVVKYLFKGRTVEAEILEYAARPLRWSRVVRMPDGTVGSRMGFDGNVGWTLGDRDLGPRVIAGRELAQWVERLDLDADLYDAGDFTSMETVGIADLNGRTCYKLELVSKRGLRRTEYFDRDTGFRVGSETKAIVGNYLVPMSEDFSDYKMFDGVMLPTNIVWRYPEMEHPQTLTVQAVQFENLPDTVFALPAELEENRWPFADRLAELLQLDTGQVVADVGAGRGVWALELARRVGPRGQVFATELDPDLVAEIRAMVAYEGPTNVSPILVDQGYTGLPPQCCDRVLLRFVYHDFTDPPTMTTGLLRALRPGGFLVVIDDAASSEDDLTDGRGNHTILPQVLVDELEAGGFELVSRQDGGFDGVTRRIAMTFRIAQ